MSINTSHVASNAARRPCKPERLFRAAIDAYCALPRPTRAEADRLDDLALPLLDGVSVETMRFAAAALSEAYRAPADLVRKLANQPPDISAPLLMRSEALTDIDLIALIGRHGLPHARVIARRTGLNPQIAALIATLDGTLAGEAPEQPDAATGRSDALEEARERLREMMAPRLPAAPGSPHTILQPLSATRAYLALRDVVLKRAEAYPAALARLGVIMPQQARAICISGDIAAELGLLRFLGLSAEQMFLIMACRDPAHIRDAAAAGALLGRYATISHEWAKTLVMALRRDHLPRPVNANDPRGRLRAVNA